MTDFHAHLPMWAKKLAEEQERVSVTEAKARPMGYIYGPPKDGIYLCLLCGQDPTKEAPSIVLRKLDGDEECGECWRPLVEVAGGR